MVYSNLYRRDPLRDFLGGNHPPEAVDLVEKMSGKRSNVSSYTRQ